jgi:oligoendopeptidase F
MSTDLTKKYPRKYHPEKFNPGNEDELKEQYKILQGMKTDEPSEFKEFVSRWSELSSIIDEAGSMAYVNMSVNTKDKKAEEEYFHFVEKIYPICDFEEDKLKEKFLSSPSLNSLDQNYYGLFIKKTRTEKEIFRKENINLFVEDSKLSQSYQKITGGWMIEFQGKSYTPQQMSIFLENPDRSIRESAYRARVDVHLKDVDKLEDIYDRMLSTRSQIAKNAGFSNFRDYTFVQKARFDYTPEDCLRFHDSIAETIVPLLNDWMKEKATTLGVESIRPWDLYVDPEGGDVIKAFETTEDLCEKTQKIFESLSEATGNYFSFMRNHKLLNLDSREGKAPGGYMMELSERRVPFIFMNAVGLKRDVDTLLHEGGHSIHAFEARDQELKSYRSSPLEFAEVASMSMELMGRPYLHYIYNEKDLNRVKKDQLVKIIEFFPFMSMIDSFQHWVYTTDKNGRKERGDKWQELNKKFQPYLNMKGLEEIERTRWQYPHIFTVPFYYIEYGIAQIGALQVWKNSIENEKLAVEKYLSGLSLGGSRPLPELFRAAGIRFSMDKNTLSELVDLVKREIDKLG